MAFKPKKSFDSKQMYKQHLLNGDVLKIDGGAYDQIDLIPRSCLNAWSAEHNVGWDNEFEKLPRHTKEFYDAINELKADGYVVKKLACDYSGCCQYHANRYYLAGEND